jgi:NAD+ synthase (glutamine-hydrolysing)
MTGFISDDFTTSAVFHDPSRRGVESLTAVTATAYAEVMSRIRVAACQLNTVVGDLHGNVDRIIDALAGATRAGADVAVFPELAITGYPPEDLLLKPRFVQDNLEALERVAQAATSCVAVVGFVDRAVDLHNAAAICHDGKVVDIYHKRHLPNYGVFDEQRYFAPGGPAANLYGISGVKVGICICEDAWSPHGPIAEQANAGAELILNLNASPYYAGKLSVRERMLAVRAADASVPLVYVNQVGGQDELVFDGASLVLDADGQIVAAAAQFVESLMIVDVEVTPSFRKRLLDPRGRATTSPLPVMKLSDAAGDKPVEVATARAGALDPLGEVYNALVLGTQDYVRKNGFTDVVIGLSGGIDSSLVAAIAVDALGADRVHGIAMPSRYSSAGSLTDAARLAEVLGIDCRTIAIEAGHAALGEMLRTSVEGDVRGLTDENLQSRLRGVLLMALSNEYGWLVLTTGNKSELAVGYSTLYGDSAGGFAVIKDVAKTTVYELCRWRNGQSGQEIIPETVLTKAPSAELRPDQRDDQSLPPYENLDPIIEAYVEDDLTAGEIVRRGFDAEIVRRIVRMVDLAEYKRRQSPLGVRVTPKAFGKDRRVPITNRYPG